MGVAGEAQKRFQRDRTVGARRVFTEGAEWALQEAVSAVEALYLPAGDYDTKVISAIADAVRRIKALGAEQPATEEQWVYGDEAQVAAVQYQRTDWQDVTGWPLHLEQAYKDAKAAVAKARNALMQAQQDELRALHLLMANDAMQKRPQNRETWMSEDGRTILWGALVGCEHEIVGGNGGGIRCTKCEGWFCY